MHMPFTQTPFTHGGSQSITVEREEEGRIITVQVIFPTTQRSRRGWYWMKRALHSREPVAFVKYLDVPLFKRPGSLIAHTCVTNV